MLTLKKISLPKISFLLLFILFIQIAKAQPQFIQLNQFTSENGLSASNINEITQDNHGFIWIATGDGLNRFDGSTFKVYKKIQGSFDEHSLPDNFVISVDFSEQQGLFLGLNTGLSKYDPTCDGFINYYLDSTSCLFGHSFQVRTIEVSNDGTLFLGTREGLVHFDPEKNTFTKYSHNESDSNSLCSNVVNDLKLSTDKRLWIATSLGLDVLNLNDGKITHLVSGTENENFSEVQFYDVIEDKTGTIWAGSDAEGLFRIVNDSSGREILKRYTGDSEHNDLFVKKRLLSLDIDNENTIWVGVENNGLYGFNSERKSFVHYLSEDDDPFTTKTYSVESLFIDDSGNIWIGTYSNGIGIISKNSDAIITYSKFKGGDLRNTNNMVNSFYQTDDHTIWIATDGGGINILNKETGFFTCYNAENSNLPSDYILSILEDRDGTMWFATWGEGLVRFDKTKNSFTKFTTKNSGIAEDNIFQLINGYNNDLLMTTLRSGLSQYSLKENRWKNYNTRNSSINDDFVNVVRKDGNGAYYVGTRTGIMKFQPESGIFSGYDLSGKNGMFNRTHVYDIFVENGSSVWIATLSGLNHLNPETGENKWYTTAEGLPSDVVLGIVKDREGYFWFTTKVGIVRYNQVQDTFITYSKVDGLQSDEFRPRSAMMDHDGNIYLGGVNGFNIIDPARLGSNSKVPKIVLTGLDIMHKPVKPGDPGSPLTKIISETDELKFSYRHSVLTFHFSVLDYVRPQKNKLAYKLENFDEEWVDAGTSRQVTYTNLDPGEYILKVIGANNDGVWNNEGVQLRIEIVPPWWNTLWFKISLIAALIIFLLGVYFMRVTTLNRQKLKLELAVEARTKELAEINATKDKLFTIIAHDLRSPFNVILGYTDLLLQGYEELDKKMINKVLQNLKTAGDSAYSLLDNLLIWSRSQRHLFDFVPQNIEFNQIINKVLAEIGPVSANKNIEIINELKDREVNVWVDENMLTIVLRNLIANAIKFSNENSKIYIVLKTDKNGKNTIGVKDEGVGISAERIESIFILGDNVTTKGTKGESGSGLGLILCKEFIEKHGENIWVESEPGKGSTFWFTVSSSKV